MEYERNNVDLDELTKTKEHPFIDKLKGRLKEILYDVAFMGAGFFGIYSFMRWTHSPSYIANSGNDLAAFTILTLGVIPIVGRVLHRLGWKL